ncbi:MAG: leucyl aminopeptidase [Planctomycetaceae bacterium]|nr:leucyl aminopeptidase [Planctomycetaceae bacterium]
MQVEVTAGSLAEVEADWLVVFVPQDSDLPPALAAFDKQLGGLLQRLRETEDLTGKPDQTMVLHGIQGLAATRLVLVGIGKSEECDLARLGRAASTAARIASSRKSSSIAVALPEAVAGSLDASATATAILTSLVTGSAGQSLYRSEPDRHPFEAAIVVLPEGDASSLRAAAAEGQLLGEAVNLTRELVNLTADDIYPESFASRAEQVASGIDGLTCTILDEQQLEAERFGSLLAVARGSDRPPRVVVLEYRGAGENDPQLALVGKGVTFDSGGLSLKPSEGMNTMKCDMAGAATVLGAISAIARLKLPVNVTGYMGLVENMVSGRSYKLGDVLKARSGTTIEVLNTDAEGRLVLADVLDYAVEQGASRIVDLATLTGACVVALGEDVVGLFASCDDWSAEVQAAASRAGEQVWAMPMFDHFAELLKSDVADCKNIGTRWGGAITAAKFLEKFTGERPWVHLDIAGPSFASSNKPHREGGGTGCMVRTLIELARQFK